ncbi:Leucine Rich repeat-containing domain protein [Paragonimus heterotremus]|uniref:Leucine Rich repeat-containing domain protein n=1 Tax=Paragonimus heterotremus TaxID=100268 RepID=A0A8J4SYU5_9TREM|nr:Leucine Rich repeat-containing domain protein [Paragonimus heterotremus]
MPIFPRKQTEDYRRLLERKLYLARERPDELFDLSGCSLKEIPDGTFALIKVLLKTHLYLQNNSLRTLDSGGNLVDLQRLEVLDLSANNLHSLPDGLKHLVSLKVLNLSGNRISTLPCSVFHLNCLHTLNVEGNLLKSVPPEIGGLGQLTVLLLAGNPFSELPDQICHLSKLERLTLPISSMRYPPPAVCEKGITAILSFLGGDKESPIGGENGDHLDAPPSVLSDQKLLPSCTDSLVTQKFGDQRLPSSELERQLQESFQAQLELANKATHSRQKVLSQLAKEQAYMQAELMAVQRKRDKERGDLVSSLLTAEDSADDLIRQLLSRTDSSRRRERAEDLDCLKLLDKPDESFELRRQEILASMQNMLLVTDEAYQDHWAQRQMTKQNALTKEDFSTARSLEQALTDRSEKQRQLTTEIAMKEDAQKEAFAKLQAQQDAQGQRLRRDIALIEQELCRLTAAEQERRARHAVVNQHCLAERRSELVKLLTQLNKEQQLRQSELQNRLREMDERRLADQSDYWLIQYQRLLDKKPCSLNCELDPAVLAILKCAGAGDFMTNFQYHRITYSTLVTMTDDDLQKIGVYALGARQSILREVNDRVREVKLSDAKITDLEASRGDLPVPSAPPAEEIAPSAPPEIIARFEQECCVCQDSKCLVILLYCGHVCVCTGCAVKLLVCPLCRMPISQRIQLQY